MRRPSSGENILLTPVGFDLLDLIGNDHPAATAEDTDMPGPPLLEEIADILEELHVPALIAADSDPLGVFLDGGGDDLLHRAVVPQVDHLRPRRLEHAANDVGGGVVAVEEAGRRHEADLVGALVGCSSGCMHAVLLQVSSPPPSMSRGLSSMPLLLQRQRKFPGAPESCPGAHPAGRRCSGSGCADRQSWQIRRTQRPPPFCRESREDLFRLRADCTRQSSMRNTTRLSVCSKTS